ncbi:MAG: cell division protein SepF [Thermoplasmata archaeon]
MARGGILRRHHGAETLDEESFVDLGKLSGEEADLALGAKGTVRLAEVLRLDDIHSYAKYCYQGDIVILDYTSIANDATAVKRMSADLKNIARDTGGDVAGIAKNLICLTPAGIRVDRQKLRPSL